MDPSEFDPVLGRSDAIAWQEYSVKGNLIAARPRYIREHWGESAVRDVANRLAPETRTVFDSAILPFAWFPFPIMAEIDTAIVEGPMGGDMAAMEGFGSMIARYDLTTLYKVLFKLGSPSFIMKRVHTVYRTYVRGGAIAAIEAKSDRAVVALVEGALPLYFCAYGVCGWFAAAIELSGGKDVQVAETECRHRGAPRCVWEALWK
jgi:hypothetical protein